MAYVARHGYRYYKYPTLQKFVLNDILFQTFYP